MGYARVEEGIGPFETGHAADVMAVVIRRGMDLSTLLQRYAITFGPNGFSRGSSAPQNKQRSIPQLTVDIAKVIR